MKPTRTTIALAAILAGAACADVGDAPGSAAAAVADRPPVHVDSIFPIEEEIRRFRLDLPEVDALGPGAAASRDELVARFVAALEHEDTTALRAMVMSRAEFAWLWYPFTPYTHEPYEMSPALLWFQVQQNSEKGIARALRSYGGRPLGFDGYECAAAPTGLDRNRIWDDCVLRVLDPDGNRVVKRLFGSIIGRDGRFEFMAYGNDL